MDRIDSFSGKYEVLSNFYNHPVEFEGLTYGSNEAAFQAAKRLDQDERKAFTTMTPSQAKRAGRKGTLRPDWEKVKFDVMLELLRKKFSTGEPKELLLGTGDAELVEGNYWHDNIWGDCSCPKCAGITGRNMLGKLLMQVRSELRGS